MKRVFLFGVALFVLLPFVSAFDCSLVSDTQQCLQVQQSNLSLQEKQEIYSSLLYGESLQPDFSIIENYNKKVSVTPKQKRESKYIKQAWVSLSYVSPSILEGQQLLTPRNVTLLTHQGYTISLPANYYAHAYLATNQGDCQRTYQQKQTSTSKEYVLNSNSLGSADTQTLSSSGTLEVHYIISTQIEVKHYHWKKGYRKYYCVYAHASQEQDTLTVTDSKDITLFTQQPTATLTTLATYYNTTKSTITKNGSFLELTFPNASLTQATYTYSVVFDNDIATLQAKKNPYTKTNNLIIENNAFYTASAQCTYKVANHFFSTNGSCNLQEKNVTLPPLQTEKKVVRLGALLVILLYLLIMYVLYKIGKSQWKKITFCLLFLVLIPTVLAQNSTATCGLTNLGSCLPEAMSNAFLTIINQPILPLLGLVKTLLVAQPKIDVFYTFWNMLRYGLSFFYVFIIVYAGWLLLTSSSNPLKRAHAKEILEKFVMMIVLVQGSYFLYDLFLSLSSTMASTVVSTIDPKFFLLTVDNVVNTGLQFIYSTVYALTLFVTVLFLALRFIIVGLGVILLPLGLFFFFIPPLKGYGRFILNMLGIMIFIPTINLIIIYCCSLLLKSSVFASIKILLMITCFMIVNYTLWLAIKFALKRSTSMSLKDDLNQAVKYIALLV